MNDISSSVDFDTLERAFRHFATYTDDDLLRLPTRLDNWRVGGRAALIHLLSHWAVRAPKPGLVLFASNEKEALVQGQNLSDSHHGIVAMLAASQMWMSTKSTRTLLPENARRMLLNDLVENISLVHDDDAPDTDDDPQKPPGLWRGPQAMFLCSYKHNMEFPPHLYHLMADGEAKIKSAVDFGTLFKKIIAELCNYHKSLSVLPPEVQKHIGAIVHELFKNTDEHAREFIGGARIDDSLRGVWVALHAKTGLDDLRLAETRNSSPVKDYLERFPKTEESGEQAFLEINVWDNGPGLASRWNNCALSELSLQQEWEAVQTCWLHRATTKDVERKGMGLYRVAKALSDCDGFLRVRTGRLALYRDFRAHSYPDAAHDIPTNLNNLFSKRRLTLWDFTTRKSASQELTALTPCEGVLMSLLIPMDRLHPVNQQPSSS